MKRLYRSRTNKVFTGVCGGLGDYMDIDPVFIRIATAVLTVFTGIPLIAYIVAIFVIPMEPYPNAAPATASHNGSQSSPNNQYGTHPPSRNGMEIGEHIRILGFLYIAFSVIGVVIAIILFAAITGGGLISGDESVIAITTIVGVAIAAVLILLSAPGIVGGIGLVKKQAWARILVLVLGFINLLNIPFGTALGIYTIWVLTNKDSEAVFE